MENAHYFLHVTDTHLCFDAEAPDTCCTEQALRSLYQTAFAWDHRPAFVLITGDLVHEGTSADYARAKTLLQELDEQYHTKTYPALGNHDIRKNFNSAFRGLASDQPLDYCVQNEWLRWIVLDSSCARSLANCPAANLRGWSRSCANPQTAQRSSRCTTRYTERLQRKPMPTTLPLRTA